MFHIVKQFQPWMTWDNHGLYETNKYSIRTLSKYTRILIYNNVR
jgi:hypothetical protein